MLKKIFALMLVAMVAFSAISTCAADVSCSVSVDVDNACITLDGKAVGNTLITLVAMDVPVDSSAIVVDESSVSSDGTVDELIALKQIYSDGSYLETIGLPEDAPAGRYTAYVTASGEKASYDFIYYDGQKANEIVELLLTAKENGDESEFKSLIDSNTLLVGIDADNPVFTANSREIVNMLYNSDFTDRPSFVNNYNLFLGLSEISHSDASDILNVIDSHKLALGLDSSSITDDTRLTQQITDELCNLLTRVNYAALVEADGTVDFSQIVNENKALATMRCADNWGKIKKCLTDDFDDVYSSLLTNSDYLKVKDKDEVFAKMVDKTFSTLEDVEQAFSIAAKAVYKDENKHTSSKGGGSSGKVVTPSMPPIDTVDKASATIVFSDVSDEHWCCEAVAALEAKGVVSGFPDGSFGPDLNVTRAEFAKMIVAYVTESANSKEEVVAFDDVNPDDWFYASVIQAASCGIVQGYDGVFNPHAQIKREDAALIIYRILTAEGRPFFGSKYFKDRLQITDYAKSAVEALGNASIINGDDEGNFSPKNPLTRAQAAQIIYNAFEVNREGR